MAMKWVSQIMFIHNKLFVLSFTDCVFPHDPDCRILVGCCLFNTFLIVILFFIFLVYSIFTHAKMSRMEAPFCCRCPLMQNMRCNICVAHFGAMHMDIFLWVFTGVCVQDKVFEHLLVLWDTSPGRVWSAGRLWPALLTSRLMLTEEEPHRSSTERPCQRKRKRSRGREG